MAGLLRTLTLGCKVNQYETELVREGLRRIGYRDAADGQPADLCVVNTCTVTEEGDAKSRKLIRRLAKRNPHSRIVVMGCYATRAPDELARLPNVAEVVTDKRELPDLLGRFGVNDLPTGISDFANRHRAYVKIQDGCLLRCSYCIIPHVRPHFSSRAADEIEDEVRRLIAAGFREIILTGVHLGHFGVEQNAGRPKSQWLRLATLLRRLMTIDEPFRVRLSSIEATEVTRELLEVMGEFPARICPHLHVCLQSGSDRILRRMKRRWGVKRFVDRCRLACRVVPDLALTTDVIVGFPGETDADFAATCQVIRELAFSKTHVFPFSSRRGTPAANLPEQIAPRVKAARCVELQSLDAELRRTFLEQTVGRRVQVLLESPDRERPDVLVGTSAHYAPIVARAPVSWCGQLRDVTAVEIIADRLLVA